MRVLLLKKRNLRNTRVYNLSSGPHITHFLAVVAGKRKNVKSLFRIEHPSKHSVLTADDNGKVTWKAF